MSSLQRLLKRVATPTRVGHLAARYLRFVWSTNRWADGAVDPYSVAEGHMPAIIAMWHGQHFLVPFVRRPDHPSVSLVSRSSDGEIAATIVSELGVRAIRGSGASGRKTASKGGAGALLGMVRALKGGESVVLTADVPKVARVCGAGIIALARISGRPIVPLAVVTSRSLTARSWDKASIPLPFGRKIAVASTPIYVAADATPEQLEEARLAVEAALVAVHAAADAALGRTTAPAA
jgi:hypothetical protein